MPCLHVPRMLGSRTYSMLTRGSWQSPVGPFSRLLHSCIFHMARINSSSLTSSVTGPELLVVCSRTPIAKTGVRHFIQGSPALQGSKGLGGNKTDNKNQSEATSTGGKPSSDTRRKQYHLQTCQVFNQDEMLVGQMTIRAAEDLAKKEGLRLLDMGKNADHLLSFRLVSGKELMEERKRLKQENKGAKAKEKEFRIMCNITDHDLDIKVRQAKDCMLKGGEAKFIIKLRHQRASPGADNKSVAELVKKITTDFKDIATIKHGIQTEKEHQLLFRPVSHDQTDADH